MQDVESVATSVFPFWILCTKRWLLRGFRLSAQAEPLQCVPDRLTVGRSDIAEGLHELAAVHHKGLVELIEHLSDFAQQGIDQAQHPYQEIGDRTHPGGQMGLLEEEGEHLARGQRRCVGNMPALAKRFLMRDRKS